MAPDDLTPQAPDAPDATMQALLEEVRAIRQALPDPKVLPELLALLRRWNSAGVPSVIE